MKLMILLCSLLFAAIAAKDVYVEGATTTVDSPGAAAVVPAAKLGVNEAPAANHRRMPAMTGEEACQGHGYGISQCKDVGCCQWAACPSTSPVHGGGQCHSAAVVQDGQCTSVPFDEHFEDGLHCWADLKDTHVDGCRRGFWGFLSPRCGACEGDCDNDNDCEFTGRQLGVRGKCFQRNGYTPVPGCKGTGKKDWDYCIYGKW